VHHPRTGIERLALLESDGRAAGAQPDYVLEYPCAAQRGYQVEATLEDRCAGG
jgi:hypothetical protein